MVEIGTAPSSAEADGILAEAALAEGVRPDSGVAPGVEPPSKTAVSSRTLIESLWPVLEENAVKLGGEHWRFKPMERETFLCLLDGAYPELELDRYKKLVFWVFTASLLVPRMVTSLQSLRAGKAGAKNEPTGSPPTG